MVGLGQQWMAAPAWMAATDPVGNGSRVMSARSSSTPLRIAAHEVGVGELLLCCSSMGCIAAALQRAAQIPRSPATAGMGALCTWPVPS